MPRLIIISNRLPVTIDRKEGGLHFHPSAGGLATGLNSLDAAIDRQWIGWPGRAIDNLWEQEAIRNELSKDGLIPVFLSQKEIELFYEGFSNKVIWPHFHYFTQFTTYEESFWEAYREVNRKFASIVIKHLKKDDIIWVHDYQLLLLPQMIREAYPDSCIGFFLHIPFPSYEIFRILPWRRQILEGMLGADLIGFHTFGYMRHFLSATYRITGNEHSFGKLTLDDRLVNVDVFPMGIDYDKYAFPQADIFREDKTLKIRQLAKGKKLIISIDRLDYTKGIPQRIEAFKRFISENPQFRTKVTLVLIVVPSRSNVAQYQDLKNEVETLVGEINGAFGTFDWVPIQYFYRSLDFNELTTLYRVAEVALITPLRDGMNLVAKEYIAAKEESKKGVLILSEMTGAANELTDAIIVNPQDSSDMVKALKTALEMNGKEQAYRLEKMQERLKRNTVKHWAETFLKEQINLMETQKLQHSRILNKEVKTELLHAYDHAKKRLIILDYDGTLMNFQTEPKAVVPDEGLLEILKMLKNRRGNRILVNSGRDKTTLESWLGHLEIDLVAEHGVWIKKEGDWEVDGSLEKGWKKEIRPVLENLVERTPGSFVEEKEFSLVWHYRMIDKGLGEKRVREFRDVLLYLTANLDLQVLEGNKVVEIKNAGVNKGKAMKQWLSESDWDFILAIGDDHTDEDTFKAMPPEAFTIKVGLGKTAARFYLISVKDVRELLKALVKN